MKKHAGEIVVMGLALMIVLFGLMQIFHGVAYSCKDSCYTNCICYWSGGGGQQSPVRPYALANQCYSRNATFSCENGYCQTELCGTWCNQWQDSASCVGGGIQ